MFLINSTMALFSFLLLIFISIFPYLWPTLISSLNQPIPRPADYSYCSTLGSHFAVKKFNF